MRWVPALPRADRTLQRREQIDRSLDRANFHNVPDSVARNTLAAHVGNADLCRCGHQDHACPAPQRFMHALLEVRHRAQFARQAHFADRHRSLRQRPLEKRPGHREKYGEIRRWLRNLEPPERLREDILIGEPKPAVLLKHGDQHRKTA